MTAIDTNPSPREATTETIRAEYGLSVPDTAEAIVGNAHAILPVIAEEADEIERLARLSPRAERVMRAAGVFEMGFPAHRGGVEATLAQQVEVTALIAAVDASAGWNVGVLNAGGYYAGRLGDEAYAELYPTRDMPTSGAFHPRGRAERVDGGYLVTGEWNWGSGSYTAEHIVGGAEVFENGEPVTGAHGKQMHLGLWLPRPSIEVSHNWQTLGVRGSGSTSYSITEPAFVPAGHAFDREALDNGDADPLNKSVHVSHFALTGVVLGVARHAVQLAGDFVRARLGSADAAKIDAATRQALGEAMGEVDFAYAGVREVARLTDEVLWTPGLALTPVQRTRMTAANAVAANALRRSMNLCMEIASASYILDVNPIQRVLRDGMSALAHAGTRRTHLGTYAAAALNNPQNGYTIPDDVSNDGGARVRESR
ncbi:acyl-CoA dehydrogenase family protein [Herbiconiux ginsengi]|uniref:Acyl-CoA dehydrogenase n=1 Tax=Herbiconiux ginsengi TaxID=381665 RepID=A0A1H3KWM4_9MICO|nr:acyl-CoA dehydrogenase family protein [Herbiconiux ginsengi]SDY56416.1 Acyl-CoA dehydrogenase [Herbiconiux ginsengi]